MPRYIRSSCRASLTSQSSFGRLAAVLIPVSDMLVGYLRTREGARRNWRLLRLLKLRLCAPWLELLDALLVQLPVAPVFVLWYEVVLVGVFALFYVVAVAGLSGVGAYAPLVPGFYSDSSCPYLPTLVSCPLSCWNWHLRMSQHSSFLLVLGHSKGKTPSNQFLVYSLLSGFLVGFSTLIPLLFVVFLFAFLLDFAPL